jgi:anti-sigma regulatory factor (Ser/Thr protein kinase)
VARRGRDPASGETRSIRLRASECAPTVARRWIGWLAGHLAVGRMDDLRLVVSELVTNAVLHSGLAEGEPIHVIARAEPGKVRVTVCDCGRGFSLDEAPSLPPADEVARRGLWIVGELADRMLVDGGEGRVSVELHARR